MIKEIQFYFKVRPLIQQIGVLAQMPLSLTRFIQILMSVLQILNLSEPLVSPKFKPYMAVAIGIVQVVIHEFGAKVNPDGTPAEVAYEKDKKLKVKSTGAGE